MGYKHCVIGLGVTTCSQLNGRSRGFLIETALAEGVFAANMRKTNAGLCFIHTSLSEHITSA